MTITIAFTERSGASAQAIADAVDAAQDARDEAVDAADATGLPLAFFSSGRPEAGELLLRLELPVPLEIDEALCVASAETASTGAAVFAITLDGISVGTVTFTASATGVFAFTDTTLSPGLLKITAPGSQDATLADVSITIIGDR